MAATCSGVEAAYRALKKKGKIEGEYKFITFGGDGGTYDIYKTERVEQPSIDGTQTFDQYWSVRREKPDGGAVDLSGTISLTKHFDAWEECGLELGKMYEVALTIEGYQSSGFAEVYKNDLKIEPYAE